MGDSPHDLPRAVLPRATQASLAALALANLLPLVFVATGVWNAAAVLFFYWLENLVIGFYNLLRIVAARRLDAGEKVFLTGFFALLYGGFCLGHAVFLVDVFGYPGLAPGEPAPCCGFPPFDIIRQPELLFPARFGWPLAVLGASHGLSFITNYLLGGERLTANGGQLLGRPFGRIFVMHLWLFTGAFLIKTWNAPTAAVLALVLLKIVIDAGTHAYLHRPRRARHSARRTRRS